MLLLDLVGGHRLCCSDISVAFSIVLLNQYVSKQLLATNSSIWAYHIFIANFIQSRCLANCWPRGVT